MDPKPVIAHIRDLGVSPKAVARAAGVTPQTAYNILNGTSRRVRPAVAERILAVTSADVPAVGYRPAWPSRRRLQALRAAGWRVGEIMDASGVHADTIRGLCLGEATQIHAVTDQAVRDAYRELGPAIKRPAVWSVARRGWPLPAEWDNIDDPDEDPSIARVAYAEDYRPVLEAIIEHHGSQREVARVLGLNPSTVSQMVANIRTPSVEVRQKLAEHYVQLHSRRGSEGCEAA